MSNHPSMLWYDPTVPRGPQVCALLYRHRDWVREVLGDHMRDQLVALVMLSDDICEL